MIAKKAFAKEIEAGTLMCPILNAPPKMVYRSRHFFLISLLFFPVIPILPSYSAISLFLLSISFSISDF